MKICNEYKFIDNYGKCNLFIRDINLKKKDYSEAIMNYEKALYFFIKNNDKENIFKCYVNIGKIYIEREIL